MRLQEIGRQEIVCGDNTDKCRDEASDHDNFITLLVPLSGAMLHNNLDLGFLSLVVWCGQGPKFGNIQIP